KSLDQYVDVPTAPDGYLVEVEGPMRSLEGHAYFNTKEHYDMPVKVRLGRVRDVVDGRYPFYDDQAEESHFLRWGTGGLYEVLLDSSDSNLIGGTSPDGPSDPIALSLDRSHVIYNNSAVVRLSDDSAIYAHSYVTEWFAAGAPCMMGHRPIVNPKRPEIILRYCCASGHYDEECRFAMFDYVTREFWYLESLFSLPGVYGAQFAPDGDRLVLLSGGKAHLITRSGER
ncbi:MAG: hypothetical protein KAW46_04810, partial [candidate division Zixibacteria bacterium]|nr:hypothetical protein [candidate division Zixibacteria bacterium]